MRRLRSRLSYANVMATLAVFIALGGTATAAVIITSNEEVAPDTISGHNPPEGAHPNLIENSISQADLGPDAQTCRTSGLLSIATREPSVQVCRSGALVVTARCLADRNDIPPATSGVLLVRTSVDDSFATGENQGAVHFGPTDDASLLEVRASGRHGGSSVGRTDFVAGAPDGSQLAGVVGARVTKLTGRGAGSCEFVVGASK